MTIHFYPKFHASYRKLSLEIKKKAERREIMFRNNPFDTRLKTHKLHGKLKDLWSFSIDERYRVLFEFDGDDVIFLDVGDHDMYK
ncbi:MAG: type II toxin-antitoxin system YoeB family toxin [Ignavibacteriales bacterium]|nr:type II toxin-antitoxin system YoeB family toxin [Ignavibacteriales bacterium]